MSVLPAGTSKHKLTAIFFEINWKNHFNGGIV